MEITEKKQDSITILQVSGRLDSRTSTELEEKLNQAITDGENRLIIDFEDLSYISSAGLRVILKTAKMMKKNDGMLILCAMQDYVREVFEISGFDAFLPITTTSDDALCQINPG